MNLVYRAPRGEKKRLFYLKNTWLRSTSRGVAGGWSCSQRVDSWVKESLKDKSTPRGTICRSCITSLCRDWEHWMESGISWWIHKQRHWRWQRWRAKTDYWVPKRFVSYLILCITGTVFVLDIHLKKNYILFIFKKCLWSWNVLKKKWVWAI